MKGNMVLAELESASSTIDEEHVVLAGDEEAGQDEVTKVYHHLLSKSPINLAMVGLTREGIELAACTQSSQPAILRLDEHLLVDNSELRPKLEFPRTTVGCTMHVFDEPVVIEFVGRLRL